MKATFIIAALAAFALSAVTMVATTGPAYANSWEDGGACSNSYRQRHRTAGCLHAWWDNTPPISSGVALGSKYGAQNKCSQYGEIVAHIDLINTPDEHFVLDNSSRTRGWDGVTNVRQISCCMNESDLCHRQQVEAKNGIIRVYTGSGTRTRDVDVSTHAKRWEFCRDNEDTIYCEVDPEGDAFTAPNCEDHPSACTEDDCEDAYENSEIYEYCSRNVTYAIGLSEGRAQCTIGARCRGAVLDSGYSYSGFDVMRWFLEDVDDLVFCPDDGFSPIKVGSC